MWGVGWGGSKCAGGVPQLRYRVLVAQLLRELAELGVSDLSVAVAIDPKAHCRQLCVKRETERQRQRGRQTETERGRETVHL